MRPPPNVEEHAGKIGNTVYDRRPNIAKPHDRKPILTIEQQIEHLKQKGVAFELCSEEKAADYLHDS